jgi:hypothetical protein
MAEAELDRPIVPHAPTETPTSTSTPRKPPWLQGLACVAILPLLGFIGFNGRELWGEFWSLRQDQGSVRASEIIGYVDINPVPNYARSPDGWIHSEGDTRQLWAGWQNGKHHWFLMGTGDIDPKRFSTPMGQDSIRAVDFPLFETAGGKCWGRVNDDDRMAIFKPGGEAIAYPLTVLDKVELVNDQIGENPVLVLYTPVTHATFAYESVLDGKRVTFGHGGYFFGNHPVLYDRGTESLWTEVDGAMVAVSGRRKGTTLKRIAQLDLVSWSDWKVDHPGGRLLIGADRSKPRPLN